MAGIWLYDFELVFFSVDLFLLLICLHGRLVFFPRLGFLDRHSCTIPIPLFSLLSVSFGASLFFFFLTLLLWSWRNRACRTAHREIVMLPPGSADFFLAGTTLSVCLPFCLGSWAGQSSRAGGHAGFGGWRPKPFPGCFWHAAFAFAYSPGLAGAARERSVSSGRVTCPLAGQQRPPNPWSPEWAEGGGEANGGFG